MGRGKKVQTTMKRKEILHLVSKLKLSKYNTVAACRRTVNFLYSPGSQINGSD